MVLVSVIMPSFNQERYISEAIDSVLNQSFRDFELIIIDNVSTDRSKDIIKDYEMKDSRIKTIFHDVNEGISGSLNEGIDLAKGKFIAIICTDDIWYEKKLEKQLKILKINENLIIFTEGILIDRNGYFTGSRFAEQFIDKMFTKTKGFILTELYIRNFVLFSSLLFKKEIIKDLRFKRELRFINDYLFEITLSENYKYYFINDCLTKYRYHEVNTLSSENITYYKDSLTLFKIFEKKYSNIIPKELICYNHLRILHQNLYLTNNKEISLYINKILDLHPLKLSNLLRNIKFIPKTGLLVEYLLKEIIDKLRKRDIKSNNLLYFYKYAKLYLIVNKPVFIALKIMKKINNKIYHKLKK